MSINIISFTGHQVRTCDESRQESHLEEYPSAVWVTGGAIGFDRQVERFATKYRINNLRILPEYKMYGRRAPLIRDEEIVKKCDLLIALYDGRQYGGTNFTLKKARQLGKEIRVWKPIEKSLAQNGRSQNGSQSSRDH